LTSWQDFSQNLQKDLNQSEDFSPARLFASSRPAIAESNVAGKQKGKTMDPLIQLQKSALLFVTALLLTCFALSPGAQAVVPPPDGGYPNANTAEGTDALFSLTIGSNNTAIGFNALFSTPTEPVIQRLVLTRSFSTPAASRTWPSVLLRS
jgi:hypothetical protein